MLFRIFHLPKKITCTEMYRSHHCKVEMMRNFGRDLRPIQRVFLKEKSRQNRCSCGPVQKLLPFKSVRYFKTKSFCSGTSVNGHFYATDTSAQRTNIFFSKYSMKQGDTST